MQASPKTAVPCRILTIAILASLASAAWADGDPVNGRSLAQGCAHCHGLDGNARSTSLRVVPMLAGQPAAYLVQEMRNYAEGVRADPSKNRSMAKKLQAMSETDFEDIATHYEAQKRY
jgi:cytochrome c553